MGIRICGPATRHGCGQRISTLKANKDQAGLCRSGRVTVGILKCRDPPEALRAEHGSYGAMVKVLLGPARETAIHDVPAGALPASVAGCDAYVLTGSPAGVYDDLAWIPGLLRFLRQAGGRAKLVGICFGHQAMAQAFGNQVINTNRL
jgi:hypothetical protein